MVSLLWTITVVLLLLWLLGFAVNIGAWIHFLLILVVLSLIFNMLSWSMGRRGPGL